MLHPERTWPGGSLVYKRLKKLWDQSPSPSMTVRTMDFLHIFSQTLLPGIYKDLAGEYMECLFFPIMERLIEESPNKDSYTETSGSAGGRELQPLLLENSSGNAEALVASMLTHYAVIRWVAHNKPVYTVSGDLAEALQNTQLRKYPSSLLALPFPALYLELPPGQFQVAAGVDGIPAPAEGVYILEECGLGHRTWRLIVVSPEEREVVKEIDGAAIKNASVWFFSVEFPEGETVDDCIKYTLDKVATPNYVEHKEIEGDDVEIHRGLNEEQMGRFKRNRKAMVELFRYVMNVMIYVTSAEADITYWNASKEYRDLKARAAKAKGPKREALNTRLRSAANFPRIVLGRNVVIDRKLEDTEADVLGGKRTMKVRTYVPGYWNTYHVGVGRTQTITKLVKPHFRGPEEAPLTTPERHVVK